MNKIIPILFIIIFLVSCSTDSSESITGKQIVQSEKNTDNCISGYKWCKETNLCIKENEKCQLEIEKITQKEESKIIYYDNCPGEVIEKNENTKCKDGMINLGDIEGLDGNYICCVNDAENFQECLDSGYPVREVFHKECITPWGEIFIQEIKCPLEAKKCPDGTWVTRSPPSCDFLECT